MPRSQGSAPPSGGADPRPREVVTELERLDHRWGSLPIAQAEAAMPAIRLLLDRLTKDMNQPPVPDIGTGGVIHQLHVLVWEAYRAGRAGGIPDALTALRREL